MSADDDLELRLRSGLRAAAEALPAPQLSGSRRAGGPRDDHRSRRRVAFAGAAAALLAATAGVGIATAGGDGDDVTDLRVTQAPSTTGTEVPDLGPAADPGAGSAVVIGAELVSFGPDGQPGERLSLAPLTDIQSIASDRHGGWIACGTSGPDDVGPVAGADAGATAPTSTVPAGDTPTAPTSTIPAGDAPPSPTSTIPAGDAPPSPTSTIPAGDAPPSPTSTIPGPDGRVEQPDATSGNTYWFRPGQEAQPLPVSVACMAGSLDTTEVDGHPVLAYASPVDFSIRQLDLQTGADSAVDVATPPLPSRASVGGGRLAVFGEAGLEVWDLATAEPVAIGQVDLPVRAPDATEGLLTDDLALSPDGTVLAALVGDIVSDSEVVVVDLASGTEVFRQEVAVSLEGAQVAFDGTTVAVGNYYDSYGPVRIFDIATGAERTVDAHGLLP